MQIFNLFVANGDIAYTTKHFQFHIVMNKSYQQQLIFITIKFYLLVLHLPCRFKNQLPILCQIFQTPCQLWTTLFCVTANTGVLISP